VNNAGQREEVKMMSEIESSAHMSDVVALASRIRELEAQLIRQPATTGRADADTNCTNCNTNCTNCAGDRFQSVLLPGEFDRLSGGELVRQLRAGQGK
jgi:hypothetical protein